jgi:hypothetical protein
MIDVLEVHQEREEGKVHELDVPPELKARICTLTKDRVLVAFSNHQAQLEVHALRWTPGSRTWTKTDQFLGDSAEAIGAMVSDGANRLFIVCHSLLTSGPDPRVQIIVLDVSENGIITREGDSGDLLTKKHLLRGAVFLEAGRLILGGEDKLFLLNYDAAFNFSMGHHLTVSPSDVGKFDGSMLRMPNKRWVSFSRRSYSAEHSDVQLLVVTTWHLDGAHEIKMLNSSGVNLDAPCDLEAPCSLQGNGHRFVLPQIFAGQFGPVPGHVDDDGHFSILNRAPLDEGEKPVLAPIEGAALLSVAQVPGHKLRFVDWLVSKEAGKLTVTKNFDATFKVEGPKGDLFVALGAGLSGSGPLLKQFVVPAVVIGADFKLRLLVWYHMLKFGPEGFEP